MIITEKDRSKANVVLALLKEELRGTDHDVEFELDFYHNGRENGYVLKLTYVDGHYVLDNALSRWIAFSEYRRSDDVVVYTDCGYWDGDLTEKSYDELQLFSKYSTVVKYILKIMTMSVKEVRKTWKEREAA